MARVAIMVFGVGGANTGTGHNPDVLNFMKDLQILNSSDTRYIGIIVGGHHENYPLVQI